MQNKLTNQFSLAFVKLVVVVLLLNILPQLSYGQTNNLELPTSINDDGSAPHPSAIVDINSNNRGLLIPRMKFAQILVIENPAEGLMIFDTEFKCLRLYINNCWECMYHTPNKKTAPGQFVVKPLIEPSTDSDIDFIELENDNEGNLYALIAEDDGSDTYVVKQTETGVFYWRIEEQPFAYEEFQSIDVDSSESLYIAGTIGADSISITKFNRNGVFLWNKVFNLNSGAFNIPVGIKKIKVTNSGDIFIGGNFTTSFSINNTTVTNNGSDDVFLLKLKDIGNTAAFNWLKSYGSADSDILVNLEIDNLSNVYTVSGSDASLVGSGFNKMTAKKWAVNGTELWSKDITSNTKFKPCKFDLTPTNDIIFAAILEQSYTIPNGNTINLESTHPQIFIGKFDTNGNFKFTESKHLIVENPHIFDLVASGNGALYMAGIADTFHDTCFGKRTHFLAKLSYNNIPEVEWLYSLEALNDARIALNNNNELFIGGFYTTPTTIGSQIIDDPATTNKYFHILQYVE